MPGGPKPVVIKIGGALLAEPARLAPLWTSIRRLRRSAPVLVVHGGGPQATRMARRLGHEPRIVHGRRVTGDLDLEIMQWTLRGALNTQLVAQAAQHGLPAVGLSGVDGDTLRVTKRPPWQVEGETVDFGWVGDVEHVQADLLTHLLGGGFVPVLAPLGTDAAGQVYNVNADTVACALAAALQAAQFLLVTASGGLQRDVSRPASRLARCDAATFAAGIAAGWIQGGMRVKLQVAFDALEAGVPEVYILAPDDLNERARGTQVVR